MVTVNMTLAEWREMLHPVRTESIGDISVTGPVKPYSVEQYETLTALAYAQADLEAARNTITTIRKIVNTSPIYSQREQHEKFEEIKKLVNNA